MPSDKLTPEQRARVEKLKAARAKLTTPLDKIAFDNAANCESGDEMTLRLIAMLES